MLKHTFYITAVAGVLAFAGPAAADPPFLGGDGSEANANAAANSSATGVGVGTGGDASATGGTAVQGQSLDNTNTNLNYDVNKNVGVNEQKQGQKQGQSQTGVNLQGQKTQNANNSSQDTDVTVEGDEAAEIPVASANAAALTAGANTCMGSSSGGVQGMDFGLSFGTTWHDQKCDTRLDASSLMGMGLNEAAVARVCQDADMRAAIEATGKSCPGNSEPTTNDADKTAWTTDGENIAYADHQGGR